MVSLCKYKNLFGEPNTGIHKRFRLFNIAWADVIMTIIGGALVAYFMRWNIPLTIIVFFLLGILSHRAFCVRTTVDKFLFPNAK